MRQRVAFPGADNLVICHIISFRSQFLAARSVNLPFALVTNDSARRVCIPSTNMTQFLWFHTEGSWVLLLGQVLHKTNIICM